MLTRSDLSQLIEATPDRGVSIYLPTHRGGRETRQDPIRLRDLIDEAREKLVEAGMRAVDADALLAPAAALRDDDDFWQHQSDGLALFLDAGGLRIYRVPLSFEPRTHVGPEFSVKPLLPLFAADGSFRVLAVTAHTTRLFEATRHTLDQNHDVEFPADVAETAGKNDYQGPIQGSPASRPQTGRPIAARTQVYGEAPPEWRKAGLEQYAGAVAAAVAQHIADDRLPLVLIGDAELAGHIRKNQKLSGRIAGTIETNPEALDDGDLHARAYEVVRPTFEGGRDEALHRAAELIGQGSPRAVTAIGDVVRSAYRGRVDTLLLAADATVPGWYDVSSDAVLMMSDPAHPDADLTEAAAVRTLTDDGSVYLVESERLAGLLEGTEITGPVGEKAPEFAAILRY
ncbi:hypothetical protein [Nocardia sp. CC201C]|uniref:baeRF3 domain-containing protein n=1 Tax=Nocardia sp. CC201C TaxID=3044575 RepID=UPI0024A893D9|nr:hypothetical protein [Nocardia sp. CC201C]